MRGAPDPSYQWQITLPVLRKAKVTQLDDWWVAPAEQRVVQLQVSVCTGQHLLRQSPITGLIYMSPLSDLLGRGQTST